MAVKLLIDKDNGHILAAFDSKHIFGANDLDGNRIAVTINDPNITKESMVHLSAMLPKEIDEEGRDISFVRKWTINVSQPMLSVKEISVNLNTFNSLLKEETDNKLLDKEI